MRFVDDSLSTNTLPTLAAIRAFEDVPPLLDALDAAGIPYGAVSNNVHDYQRAKLDSAGLERIRREVWRTTWGR